MRALLLSTVVLFAESARAEPPEAIDEAQLLARISGDPRLLRITAEVAAAQSEVVAARVRPNPTVSYEREEVFTNQSFATNYLRIELPVEVSGRRGLRVESARASVTAAATEGERERFAIAMAALRTFRTTAYERARIELLRSERVALVRAVEIVRKRSTAGAAAGYDLQRVELELLAYDDQIAAAEAQLARSRLELGALVGAAGGIDANDALALPAEPPALTGLADGALARHPDYRAAGARLEGARLLSRAADRAWIPDLSLGAGYESQDTGSGIGRGYTAALFVTVPIFDRGQVDRARAVAQTRAAEAERAVLARTLSTGVRTSREVLERTLARARAAAEQLARLEQLLRSAETGYREGNGNVVDLLDAHRTARDTRLRELELRRDARLAELELWLALGRRP